MRRFFFDYQIKFDPKVMVKRWLMRSGAGLALALTFALVSNSVLAQSSPELRDNHPDRYVVKEGDTLWGIATRFLKDPWRWPLIWKHNPDVENPHLIFPGDLLVVTGFDNIKVVRLKPRVRRNDLDRGIPAIPPHVIEPFLTSALIIEPGELDDAGYVLQGVDDEIVLGRYSKFYARHLNDIDGSDYRIFHIGETLLHPETGEILGIETKHLGDAKMLRPEEDISKLIVVSSHEDIGPGDRILPNDNSVPLSYFEPRAPEEELEGWIVYAPKGVREVGRFDVVIISGGEREGLKPGHVVRAMYHRVGRKDPITSEFYDPPDESSGLMMVFRVFDKLSYALIMEATRAINIGDKYINP